MLFFVWKETEIYTENRKVDYQRGVINIMRWLYDDYTVQSLTRLLTLPDIDVHNNVLIISINQTSLLTNSSYKTEHVFKVQWYFTYGLLFNLLHCERLARGNVGGFVDCPKTALSEYVRWDFILFFYRRYAVKVYK